MIHPKTSLTSGLPFQKALAAKNWFLFIHSVSYLCQLRFPNPTHYPTVPLEFSWECQTVVKHTRFKMSCITHQHGYGSLTKTKNEAKNKPKPINSHKFKSCVEVQGTKLRK